MTTPLITTPALNGCKPEVMTVLEWGVTIASLVGDRVSTCSLSRSLTQASTISLGLTDPNRELISSPLLNNAVTVSVGSYPDLHFTLVQVHKSKDMVTAAFEDSLVNRLRHQTGPLAAAPGVIDRVAFARQLCALAGVQINAPDPGTTPVALEPLTRGTSQNAYEDTWACLVRLAQDVAYRCFSDGVEVWFGPDSWLLNAVPPTTLAEFTDAVDYIDFDFDTGKPVGTATVYGYAPTWKTPVGQPVYLSNIAAATGKWLVSDISRDLFHTPVTVKVIAAQPTLPEPANNSSQIVPTPGVVGL